MNVSLDLTPRPRLRMTRLLPLIAGATLWFSTAPAQVAHRDTSFLSEAALKELLYNFADDSMLGRTARAGGHDRAVLLLARELQRAGLEPAGCPLAGRGPPLRPILHPAIGLVSGTPTSAGSRARRHELQSPRLPHKRLTLAARVD